MSLLPTSSEVPASSQWQCHIHLRASDDQVVSIDGTMDPCWDIIQNIIHKADEDCGCQHSSMWYFFLGFLSVEMSFVLDTGFSAGEVLADQLFI